MIWIDVEDLFHAMRHNVRPSGIQRLEYELCRALAELDKTAGRIRFIRHTQNGYYGIPFSLLENAFADFVDVGRNRNGLPPDQIVQPKAPRRSGLYRSIKDAVGRLPPPIRLAMQRIYYHQRSAIIGIGPLVRACTARIGTARIGTARIHARHTPTSRPAAQDASGVGKLPRTAVVENTAFGQDDCDPGAFGPGAFGPGAFDSGAFERDVRPGDVLLLLGSAWFPGYAATLEQVVRHKRVRLALLIYDIVPLRRPEWCDAALLGPFAEWMDGVLPLADVLLTISRATADDLERHAAAALLDLRCRPQPIPIGTGFTTHAGAVGAAPTGAAPKGAASGGAEPSRARLPPAGTYALIVSTIEARKNHALLFRVWRRMLQDMPHSAVPTLVFAGRVGWLVADLMAQLGNTEFLDGKIVLIENPPDGDLAALYAGCLFTLFPSFYEGWGLPVTESLAYGRPCIISNATSLPEAGGTLARYFDPDDASGAYDVIRAVIEDPHGLEAWRARILRDFRPVAWEESARAILAAIDAPGDGPGDAPGDGTARSARRAEREPAIGMRV